MAKLGSNENPAVARVKTLERAEEIIALCNERGWKITVGIEPDKPEDVTDMERLLNPPIIKRDKPKLGRNDPCPCGSGLKFKKCCLQKYE
jgi:SWIM/SEC-C metal-binding protein